MRLRAVARQFLPSRGTLSLLWLGLAVLFFGNLCALAATLSREIEDPVSMGLAVLGGGVLPLCVLLAIVGALREKGSAPRALLWLLAWAGFSLSAGLIALGMSLDPDVGLAQGALCYACACAPLSLVFFIPAGRFLVKAWPDLRHAVNAERERLAVELLSSRGQISLDELAGHLELDEERTGSLVRAMAQAGRLDGELDAAQGVVYASEHLRRQQQRLLDIVQAHGRVSLGEVERELGIPRETLKSWIYELVRRGQFSGALNWQAGLLYSAGVTQSLDGARCPSCGGQLELAGVAVTACRYCGAEFFSPPSTGGTT